MKRRYAAIIFVFILLFTSISHKVIQTNPSLIIPSTGANTSPTVIKTNTPTPTITPTANPFAIRPDNIKQFRYYGRLLMGIANGIWMEEANILIEIQNDCMVFYDMNSYELMKIVKYEDMLSQLDTEKFKSAKYWDVAYSEQSNLLAFGEDVVVTFNATTLAVDQIYADFASETGGLTFSPDGSLLATTYLGDNPRTIVWNIQSRNVEYELPLEYYDARSQEILISPDNTKLVSRGFDRFLTIWDLPTSSIIRRVEPQKIETFILSPDGRFVFGGGENSTIQVWDMDGNHIFEFFLGTNNGHYGDITSLDFNSTGDVLVASTDYGNLLYVNPENGELLNRYKLGNRQSWFVTFSPDDTKVITNDDRNFANILMIEEAITLYPTPTPMAHPDIQENYQSLPAGDYILFSERDEGISAISMDGTIIQEISTTYYGETLSTDGRLIQIEMNFPTGMGATLNLLNGQISKYSTTGMVSPNEEWIMYTTDKNDEISLYITSIQTDQSILVPLDVPLPYHSENEFTELISNYSWSPDGSKITFIKYTVPSSGDEENLTQPISQLDGLYSIDTTCFETPESCANAIRHIHQFPIYLPNNFEFVLSHNEKYAIINIGAKAYGVDLQKNQIVFEIPLDFPYLGGNQNFAFSPNDDWFVYTKDGTSLILQSVFDKKSTTIAENMEEVSILGWLTAPILKQNQSFQVINTSQTIYLHDQPQSSANILSTLPPYDTFTVLDGPIQQDGFTWWTVHHDQSGLDGWLPELSGWYEKQ